jgi:endonuclease/exonuclease/phosphatase family metal-dependent hydrolase
MATMANFINPERLWQIAFLGLAYPILLLLNLGFIIFWVWHKKMLALLSIFVILSGWSNVGRYFQIRTFQKLPKSEETLKLLSYNVRVFNQYAINGDGSQLDNILNFVNMQDAEIVCFQEFFTNNRDTNRSETYIDSALNKLQYRHFSYPEKPGAKTNYGLATYSKFPIINRQILKFEHSNNSCLFSDMIIFGDTVRVYNTHLQSISLKKKGYNFVDSLVFRFNSKRVDEVKDISGRLKHAFIKRANQVNILSDHIKKSPYPVIVCGDFNDTPVSYTYQKIRDDLQDAFVKAGRGTGKTYRGNFPSFRIDFIFHSNIFRSLNYQTHRVNLSDHYPVSCELELMTE